MKKKIIVATIAVIVVAIACIAVWNKWFGTTDIAFVNYQVIQLGEISKANDNSYIKIHELSTDDIDDIEDFDMVFINAMGLRITEEQRSVIQKAADRHVPIMTIAATNPANNISSLDSLDNDTLTKYIANGGRRNYRSMLNYVRKVIDGKLISVVEPEPLVPQASEMIYHNDPKSPDDEALGWNSVAEYNEWLSANGLWKDGAPRIVITGVMGEPSDLIEKLEQTGNVVYPVRSIRKFVTNHHIDSVMPSAIINMAHGRMGDYMVEYLNERNIPLFCPLNVNRLVDDWEADKQGMSGGFLSQSVVTPEIDGAIRPFALFGHYADDDGLQHVYAIPERLDVFVDAVNNYISLQQKQNKDKRIAIYYYKGPGQNALTAAGMEVVPSLFNLLTRLKHEGYNVDGLPATANELGQMLQRQGSVFGTYAAGAYDDFMANGNPALVTKEQYDEWVTKALRPESYDEVVDANGEFPGSYMATSDGRLAVARIQFGNVVLIPQTMAGTGSDAFKIVHGANTAPPHPYIASYLWARYAFNADAMIHFGTHGSLEFTPSKQVALSSNDWSDRLVGATPHFYVYTIADVGEAVIAKRRAYAQLLSHLTPPFMESNLRDTYKELTDAVRKYNALLPHDGTTADTKALDAASIEVKRLAVKMGIHRTLGLDSILNVPYTEEEIQRIESFGEEVANEKITGQLYTIGVPYEQERITSSVYAMATDPIAYSLLALDKLRGRADAQLEKHKTLFTQRYLTPARALVTRLLANPSLSTDAFVCDVAGITAAELSKAHEIERQNNAPQNMMAMMMSAAEDMQTSSAAHDADAKMPEKGSQKAKQAPASPHQGQPNGADSDRKQPVPPSQAAHPDTANASFTGDKHAVDDSQKPLPAHPSKPSMPEGMREKMAEMGRNMDPDKALAMAKMMGADEESLKRMEAAMKKHDGNDASAAADTSARSAHPGAPAPGNMPPAHPGDGRPDMAKAPTARPDSAPAKGKHAVGDAPQAHSDTPTAGGSMNDMMKAMMEKKEYTKEEKALANAILEVERTLKNVGNYKQLLLESPNNELTELINALNGGYTEPSPGGDAIANPNTLPTGRNLFAINAEETPTEEAWENGIQLANNTIEMYKRRHNDSIPRKVSYTLWSGEFIETGGATIAQVLYMLGVEPIRDTFGRVTDLRLIPSAELGRPRIDVVVQTSGQLRDIAASRLFLINRAVEMAAAADDDEYENQVAAGVKESESMLIDKGMSPKEAREVSYYRVFGGLNGGYGTGIQGMVNAGDRWDNASEIADVYMNNMNAFYGSEKDWEQVRQNAFAAALTRTDAVVQPRQSNTWGALSLDHVYEFMGGMNLAVRNVTGKEPDAYLSDYRNRNNVRMQEVKEAIGVESRTTLFNPSYIREKMKGEASSAATFAELIQNTYGWNVMKPDAIDGEMWDEIYDVYVKDKYNLGIQNYFEQQNPAALQEITAVMMETARKGMWRATPQQLADIAKLHVDMVNKYKPSCSGFVCDNAKLRQYIAGNVDEQTASQYTKNINDIRQTATDKNATVMKKETVNADNERQTTALTTTVVIIVVVVAVVVIVSLVRYRRKNSIDSTDRQ